jgi:hypothetical protein
MIAKNKKCCYCQGKGILNLSIGKKPCPVCHGEKKFIVLGPTKKCMHCHGTGRLGASSFYSRRCTVCNGKGWIEKNNT